MTFEALQVYFLLILYFNLILQWVGVWESYQNVAATFFVSHAVLQHAGCIQHTVGVILQLLTDRVTSTEDDEVLFSQAVYPDLRQQPPLLMLPPQAGFLRILQHQV